jgi:hypothetical protein
MNAEIDPIDGYEPSAKPLRHLFELIHRACLDLFGRGMPSGVPPIP